MMDAVCRALSNNTTTTLERLGKGTAIVDPVTGTMRQKIQSESALNG